MIVTCSSCHHANTFPQPYPYHAGFGDTAFLYNDAGNCTLTWGTYDTVYSAIATAGDPWCPSPEDQRSLEERLPLSPVGDRWRFANPPRCQSCAAPIGGPMVSGDIYYFEYEGSVILGRAGLPSSLADILLSRPSI
ncbi:MAG: hypothetical protein ABJE47_23990 [bacterium]